MHSPRQRRMQVQVLLSATFFGLKFTLKRKFHFLCINIYMHISEYVRTIFFDISIFSISEDAYVNVNSLYIKFLFNFFLPDVSSPAIPSVMFLSLKQFYDIISVADDEANKV